MVPLRADVTPEQVLLLAGRDAIHEDRTGGVWLMHDGGMVRVDAQVRELAAKGHLERIRNRSGWYAVWARTVVGAEHLRNLDRAQERRANTVAPASIDMGRVRELWGEGLGLVKISNSLGVSLQRLKAALRAEGMTIPNRGRRSVADREASA